MIELRKTDSHRPGTCTGCGDDERPVSEINFGDHHSLTVRLCDGCLARLREVLGIQEGVALGILRDMNEARDLGDLIYGVRESEGKG